METEYKEPVMVKEWSEYYYEDFTSGMFFYRPQKNIDRLNRIDVKVQMFHDMNEDSYVAFMSNDNGGPIATGATIEETENKFNEMFKLSIFTRALLSLHAKNIEKIVADFILRNPQYLTEYKNGNKGLIGLFVGEATKSLKGKGDPKMTNDIVVNYLNKL